MPKGKETSDKGGGDPLKSYTLVMGLLVVVMAVLCFVIDGTRKDYAQANTWLESHLTGKGIRRKADGFPVTIPDLADGVSKFCYTYEAAGGSGLGRHISLEDMDRYADRAGVKMKYQQREDTRTNSASKYETISMKFDYEALNGGPVEIWRLLTLLYNIESQGRYRVPDLRWKVAKSTENPVAPFDRIEPPHFTVALRLPTKKGAR